MQLFIFVSIILAIIVVVVAVYFWNKRKNGIGALSQTLLLVKLSRDMSEADEKSAPAEAAMLNQINLSEQLFAALSSIGGSVVFEASVLNIEESIYFYVAVPRESADFAKRQIQGLFPSAQVEESSDYNIFGPSSVSSAAYITLSKSYMLPLRTYREAEVDTFSPILSTLSNIDEVGEGASLQIVFKPSGKALRDVILLGIEKLKKGERLADVLKMGTIIGLGHEVNKTLFRKGKESNTQPIIDDEAIKALQMKVSKQLFSVNIRIVAAAPEISRAEDILSTIAGSLSQFSAPVRNEIKIVRAKGKGLKKMLYNFAFRLYDNSERVILNAEELAGIFHLPIKTTDVPRIKWLKSRQLAPPDILPQEGIVLGESNFRGEKKMVRMRDDDRRRHFYIIGQTGTGKSFQMLNMAVQDMQNGHGLCVIDPHGDLVNKILERCPRERIDDVIVFDPGDVSRPLALNMLEYNINNPQEKTFIVNEIQSIFNRLFSKETMGPMFEQYMRNALFLLMEDANNEPATLMEVPRIFTDDAFRKRKLARITNPTVIDFWEKEASKTTGEHSLANMSPYITTKFGNFISNDYMRPIIGQPKSSFNFRDVMDSGKILLVNLSKGKIGDINSSLLGMVITGRILMAALSRVDLDDNDRRDFYLYIDEFQNYTTDSISTILSEARKYRLNLVLANQFIEQLEDDIRESVFGNVGSIASFRVGPKDAEFLVKQFEEEFSQNDLISMDNMNFAIKLLINGQTTKPFNVKSVTVPPGDQTVREKLKELSRLTYGGDREAIEADILGRLRV